MGLQFPKTSAEREYDELHAKFNELAVRVTVLEKKILNRQFLRDASLQSMHAPKAEHRDAVREFQKLKKKIDDSEGNKK